MSASLLRKPYALALCGLLMSGVTEIKPGVIHASALFLAACGDARPLTPA